MYENLVKKPFRREIVMKKLLVGEAFRKEIFARGKHLTKRNI